MLSRCPTDSRVWREATSCDSARHGIQEPSSRAPLEKCGPAMAVRTAQTRSRRLPGDRGAGDYLANVRVSRFRPAAVAACADRFHFRAPGVEGGSGQGWSTL
jgi:hypothetical protein